MGVGGPRGLPTGRHWQTAYSAVTRTCAPGSAIYGSLREGASPVCAVERAITSGRVDVAMGGGWQSLVPESEGGKRKDKRNLVTKLRDAGVTVVDSREAFDALDKVPPPSPPSTPEPHQSAHTRLHQCGKLYPVP